MSIYFSLKKFHLRHCHIALFCCGIQLSYPLWAVEFKIQDWSDIGKGGLRNARFASQDQVDKGGGALGYKSIPPKNNIDKNIITDRQIFHIKDLKDKNKPFIPALLLGDKKGKFVYGLAIFSDDGCTVSVDGKEVEPKNAGKPQTLQNLSQSFHVLDVLLIPEKPVNITVVYTNTIYTGSKEKPDIDGCSLHLFLVPLGFITPSGDPVKKPLDAGTISNPDKIPDGANEFTYGVRPQGVLTIKLKVKYGLEKELRTALNGKFLFELDNIGTSKFEWDKANPNGAPTLVGEFMTAIATYTGLPQNNTDFGSKKATLKYDGKIIADANYEVFFSRDAANHPGQGSGIDPNWFYYWKTGEVCSIPRDAIFDKKLQFGAVRKGETFLRLGPDAPTALDGPITVTAKAPYGTVTFGRDGKGIQCVAVTVVHEFYHLALRNFLGTKTDGDMDGIANVDEINLDRIRTDPTDPDTFHLRDLDDEQTYKDYGDNEIRCRIRETTNRLPIFPSKDWANPGCQHKNQHGPTP